jgi:ComF family protein
LHLLKIIQQLLKTVTIARSCLICTSASNNAICQHCYNVFPAIDNCCVICNVPLVGQAKICGKCNTKKPIFNKCIAYYSYSYPIKQIIYLIKYNSRYEIIKYVIDGLILKLTDYYNSNWPQAIIPVPMFATSLLARGFDQAHILAKEILKKLQQPSIILEDSLVFRSKKTEPQHKLTIEQRKKNIRNAFSINKKTTYKHVAIIDDVVTSGATIIEITKLLKQAGVKKVDIWCLARAPL